MSVALASKSVSARAAVEIARVGKHFGSVQVLDGISMEVAEGELVALLGPSGCGKTTLLRLLAGLEIPTEGTISIGGTAPLEARRRQEIGVAFQRPALVPSRTALGNVELTLEICRRAEVLSPPRLLQEFGLGKFMHHYPHQLSGGMQQRVNIACALVHHPQLLLLDEPFGALDELTREAMCEWLAGVLAKSRQTAVLVTHSVEEAVTLADRVVVLSPHPGRIHEVITIGLERPRVAWVGAEFLEEVARVRRALRETVSGEVPS
jgi:NitT/TauT family transport system ATP-binding protein